MIWRSEIFGFREQATVRRRGTYNEVIVYQPLTESEMKNRLCLVAMLVFTALLSACGGVHSTIDTPRDSSVVVKEVTLLPVRVDSKEQNADALALNEQWKTMAAEELQTMMASKSIARSNDSEATVACHIDVEYGNRALRYLVGFGAGAGHMKVSIELKDKSGKVLYASNSKADLAMGMFGGDMKQVANDAITAAVKQFGAQL